MIEDMKKTKSNISMFDLYSLPQQRELLHDVFNHAQKSTIVVTKNILLKNEVQ